MTTTTVIPVVYTQHPRNKSRSEPQISSANRYTVQDHGQGYRTYSYEFDVYDYEAEEISVLLDDYGTLRIRAYRSPCREFKREYHLGGPNLETTLVRNTLNPRGSLRIDVDVRPRRFASQPTNDNFDILTFDLQGYRPENVTVRINQKGLLKVNGQHLDNTFGNNINREYYRQYQLAPDVDPDQVRARMDENQILTIELPQSSMRNLGKREYWVPMYERNYPPFYGSGPGGAYCCCNLL